MFLKSLNLKNFRNYKKLEFNFTSSSTVLIGDNAQGKTNFLESIYFLATSKSIKADRDEELIEYKQSVLRVEGELENKTKLEIAMQLSESGLKKKIMVNGIPRRVSDYSDNLAVVLFRPEDINLVIGSPSLRRYFIDQTISQVDKNYKRTVSSYENVLVRKNRVLKKIREGLGKLDELTYWTDQQIMLGVVITEKRTNFFDFINNVERKFGDFKFEYLPSEVSARKLVEYQEREVLSCSSLVGPHRDDFIFKLNNQDLSKYGSRGEQRTAVFDLKLAELSFMENILGERPVLLLDDIFSELDISHRQHVIDVSKMQQTIIATVEFDKYLESHLKNASANFWVVEGGKISAKAGKL